MFDVKQAVFLRLIGLFFKLKNKTMKYFKGYLYYIVYTLDGQIFDTYVIGEESEIKKQYDFKNRKIHIMTYIDKMVVNCL
jgi:hypothetical protein